MGSNVVTDWNRLSINSPSLLEEWNYDKNKLLPSQVSINSHNKVWWKCSKCQFEWESKIIDRSNYEARTKDKIYKYRRRLTRNPSFCPNCNSYLAQNRELIVEWDYSKNKADPYFVSSGSQKYWWICNKCKFSWKASLHHRVNGSCSCPKCNSLSIKFPHIAKELSQKNTEKSDRISYGTTDKYLWECAMCHNEWIATVNSRTCGGNGCPKCSKTRLRDGTTWDSKTEAYYYLKLKDSNKKFLYNKKYEGLSRCRYDFYLPDENKYVEVTSFHNGSKNVDYVKYLRNIVRKKRHVKNVLGANFEFVKIKLDKSKEMYLRQYLF